MKNKNVLISGAGIAGLTLAYWLKKYGFNPTLVEKHPTLRTEGYKLDIRGVAIDVIKEMELHDAIFAARTQIERALYVDDSGKILNETTPDLCGVRMEGDLEIVRGDLCRLLFKHLDTTDCLFGDSIKNITQNDEGVDVEFEKNGTRRFDLVIGADGLHSKVRKMGFGEESQFLRKLGLYISFFSIPNFLKLDGVEIEYHAKQRFAIAYCPHEGMAKAGFAFSSKQEINLTDINQQQQLLEEAFVGAGWEIPQLLSHMRESPDFYFDCMAQIHMPHWTKGRLALVGDAGYAVSPIAGQGASVALVGAYVLAGALAQAEGDYTQAFQRYEKDLAEFVKKNQALADMNVAIMEADKPSWVRSFVFWIARFVPGTLIQFCKKLGLKRTAKAANAINFKKYQPQE